MKVLLGIPTGGNPTTAFINSLQAMQLPAQLELSQKVVSGNFVPAQRELLARAALEADAQFLWMIDDDMIVPQSALATLHSALEANPQAALVGALYYSRDGLRPMTVDNWDSSNTTAAHIPAFDDRSSVKVDGVGFGCVLVRVRALMHLAPPYFPVHVYIEQSAGRVRICDEDYLFCERLRTEGFEVLLHPAVRCGHYDRASGTVHPLQWESPQATSRKRMITRSPDGSIGLQPLDENAPRAQEYHVRANVEYIEVS